MVTSNVPSHVCSEDRTVLFEKMPLGDVLQDELWLLQVLLHNMLELSLLKAQSLLVNIKQKK